MKLTWITIIRLIFMYILILISLPGCRQNNVVVRTMVFPQESTASPTLVSPDTPQPTIASMVVSSATPSPISEPETCSPLIGYSISELNDSIINPYHPPAPGVDHPHHGVDLAILEPGTKIALQGESVQVILSGVVSMVIEDRFPYGNAILVETPLQSVEEEQAYLFPIPTPWLEVNPDPALTCPILEDKNIEYTDRSIYILYAHLLENPDFDVGDSLDCGETIGRIGMSGNALNPHVHIEARFGPSGIRFESMAHYDSRATLEEMAAYCRWRVSGIFQHFDPMILLQILLASESH